MRLFLIRHAESEDNVARLLAGSRDAALTVHGQIQAARLSQHFRATGIRFSHIFASPLQRACKTADLILAAQDPGEADSAGSVSVAVTQLDILMEKHFGSFEGTPYQRPTVPLRSKSHKPAVPSKDGLRAVRPESDAAMQDRMDKFLDSHLLPLLTASGGNGEPIVAVVSHGIILSFLWQRLLRRLPQGNVELCAELSNHRPGVSLEALGSWSNTGYLELEVTKRLADDAASTSPLNSLPPFHGWFVTIKSINSTTHLRGLKRTRGGIGSARHDERQQSINNFFSKKSAT